MNNENNLKELKRRVNNLKTSIKLYISVSGIRLHPSDKNTVFWFSELEGDVRRISLPGDKNLQERTDYLWE